MSIEVLKAKLTRAKIAPWTQKAAAVEEAIEYAVTIIEQLEKRIRTLEKDRYGVKLG